MKEEGEKCINSDCSGIYELELADNCSCHINPPCRSCTDVQLSCSDCGYSEDEWECNDE